MIPAHHVGQVPTGTAPPCRPIPPSTPKMLVRPWQINMKETTTRTADRVIPPIRSNEYRITTSAFFVIRANSCAFT
jgi:hypothetical protein